LIGKEIIQKPRIGLNIDIKVEEMQGFSNEDTLPPKIFRLKHLLNEK
jgi:hypothetical protein